MNDEMIAYGTCILCGLLFIGGGVFILKSKMTPEKEAVNRKMGMPMYSTGNKFIGWGLVVLGIFLTLYMSISCVMSLISG